jgi:hypothetical protein
MKDTDHFLPGVPFTSAVNGSIRSTEDAHGATFHFERGQNTGLGWSDPTFGGFQPPKDFVGSLQPSVWKKSSLNSVFCQRQEKPREERPVTELEESNADHQ